MFAKNFGVSKLSSMDATKVTQRHVIAVSEFQCYRLDLMIDSS
jgi:hypothetical protein